MDRAELKEEIRERVGELEEDEDFFLTTQIERLLNRAQVRFAHEEQWPWLYTVIGNIDLLEGDQDIELITQVAPARHWAIALVKSNGDVIIPKRISPGEGLRVRQQTRTSTGEPRWFVPFSTADGITTVRVYPATNQDLTVEYHYIREPISMDTDADTPDMPDSYHDALVAWTCAKLWEKELVGGENRRAEQIEEYMHVLQQARKDMKQMANDEQLIVGGEEPRLDMEPFISYHNIPETLGP